MSGVVTPWQTSCSAYRPQSVNSRRLHVTGGSSSTINERSVFVKVDLHSEKVNATSP